MHSRPAAQPTPGPQALKLSRTSWLLLFCLPKYVGNRLGRPASRLPENTCVSARIAYNRGAGVKQSQKLALPLWGFAHLGRQTECERVPKPLEKICEPMSRHHLSAGSLIL